MNEPFREFEEWEKLPEEIKQSKRFVSHLKYYNQPEGIIKLAEKISFRGILELFDIEFDKLWEKMVLPKATDELKGMRGTFRKEVLRILNHPIFDHLYSRIKDMDESKTDCEKINNEIFEFFNCVMWVLFRVFDIQFQLSSLNENNDKKVIMLELEKRNRLAKLGEKFQGKNFSTLDIHYFDKVYKEYEEQTKKGLNPSYRQVALKIAKSEMGLSQDFEIINFYKRFTIYHKKKK